MVQICMSFPCSVSSMGLRAGQVIFNLESGELSRRVHVMARSWRYASYE